MGRQGVVPGQSVNLLGSTQSCTNQITGAGLSFPIGLAGKGSKCHGGERQDKNGINNNK